MRRRRKRTSWLAPQTLLLLVVLLVVLVLFINRKKMLGPVRRPTGWAYYTGVTNVYDILVDNENPSRVWFATDVGLRLYDKDRGTWQNFGTAEGLLSESIASLYETPGTLWLATWRGVNRLDKCSLKISELALPRTVLNKRTFTVTADKEFIWIGTDGRGIYRYHRTDSTVVNYTDQNGLHNNHIYTIYPDGDSVWCGGANNSLHCYRYATDTWSRVPTEAGNQTTKIWGIERQDSLLWFSTSNTGVWQYNKVNGSWQVFDKGCGFFSNHTYTLAIDGADLWVGTTHGLMRYDATAAVWMALVKPEVRHTFDIPSLAVDQDYIWYGSFGQGLGKCFKDQVKWVDYTGGLTQNYIRTLAVDQDQLWVGFGYLDGWCDVVDKHTFTWERNYTVWDGLVSANLNQLKTDPEQVYAATWQGLYTMDRATKKWQAFGRDQGYGYNDVTSLVVTPDTVWLGTDNGLYYLVKATRFVDQVAGQVKTRITALVLGSDRNLWVGTLDGTVWSFTPDTHGWDSYWSGQGNAVTSLAEYQGRVWAGLQDKGVAVISRSDKKVSTLTKKMKVFDRLSPGLVSNRVSVLTVVGEKLWIGTDSGISIIGPMASPVRLTYADGLLNDDILDIQQDTVYVWIGHNGGLTRIRKSSIAHLL